MNILIAGGGQVGRRTAEVLGGAGHDITVIDRRAEVLAALEDVVDLRGMVGNCAHATVLIEAGCEGCDLFVAATDSDELNLFSAAVAKAIGARKCLARVHHGAYFDQRALNYGGLFHIDQLICPEHLTALAIARTLRNPGAIAVEDFARGNIQLQQFVVEADASAVGMPLSSLKLPRGVRLAVIERDSGGFIPDGTATAQAGDVVYMIGETPVIEQASRMFQRSKPKRTHVVIMGGSPTAVWLCRALKGRGYSVRLFETSPPRAEELAQKLSHVTVIQDDPTDRSVFDEEKISDADAFVALTGDDEQNILAAAQAKGFGCDKAVAVVQRPTFVHLLRHVGIDQAFSPRDVAAREVQNLIEERSVRPLATLAAETADVYEVRPTLNGAATNQPLKNVKMPSHSLIAAIQRGDTAKVPGANDTIRAGDTLIVIGPHGIEKEFRKLFAG